MENWFSRIMTISKWIIDVGAFEGEEGVEIQKKLQCEANYPVLFIEPDPVNFLKIPDFPLSQKLNLAVAVDDGWVEFNRYKPETGSVLKLDPEQFQHYIDGHTGELALLRDWGDGGKIKVRAQRLDSLCRELRIEAVRFLKIDTQGYDLQVIKSFGSMIQIVDELVCEVQLQGAQIYQGSASKEEVLDYLHAHGFLFVREKPQTYGQELNMYFKRKDLLNGLECEPVVSILTPAYNAGLFVDHCIQSVQSQEYPFVEHIIQDGGSIDGTVDILEKYTDQIDWKSEKDGGQSDGLNRALQRCRGDIIGVLNADDEYLPDAIQWAVEQFAKNPDVAVIYGQQENMNAQGHVASVSEGPHPYNFERMFCCEQVIPAQAAFIRRTALEAVGFHVDVTRKTCPDYEMWVRLGLQFPMRYIPGVIARYRWHEGSEGSQEAMVYKMVESKIEVIERVCSNIRTPEKIRKLRRQAESGVYFWSASHFLPPMVHGKKGKALLLCWNGFWVDPSLFHFYNFLYHLLILLNYFHALRCMRGFLRKLDSVLFGAMIYRFIYSPWKRIRSKRDSMDRQNQ